MADRSKRHLERVLRECAESGVPDSTAPWPAIRERVSAQETDQTRASGARASEDRAADGLRTRRPLLVPDRPLGWVLAVLSVLILGLGVYAASGPVSELFGNGLPGPGSPGPGVATNPKQSDGPAGGEEVVGTPKRDRIERGGGDHTIHALAGRDTVFDIEGRNVAYGGDGGDWITLSGSLYGGPGEDQLEPVEESEASGGPGVDVVYAHNEKRNTVSCGTGRDTVYFDRALDSLAADCERQIPHQYEPP